MSHKVNKELLREVWNEFVKEYENDEGLVELNFEDVHQIFKIYCRRAHK